MSAGTCPVVRHRLAQTDSILVERCGCGTIHLTIGPFTMRIQEGALAELSHATRAALAELEGSSRDRPARVPEHLVS